MGSLCEKSSQQPGTSNGDPFPGNTEITSDGKIKKKNQTNSDLAFWSSLSKLNMAPGCKITGKEITFNYNDWFFENLTPLGILLDSLINDKNFFYFPSLFELTLCIIDYLQIVLFFKRKLKKNFFIWVNFDKFFIEKDESGHFSRVVYWESKLNDPFTMPEIVVNEDKSMKDSFNQSIHESLSMQWLRNSMNSNQIGIDDKDEFDVNSCFYTNCNENYERTKHNFSLDALDEFYALCILNFVTKCLIKKTEVYLSGMDIAFRNFKSVSGYGLSPAFIKSQLSLKGGIGKHAAQEVISWETIKKILTNYYWNNKEFKVFQEYCNKWWYNSQTNTSKMLMNEFKLTTGDVEAMLGKIIAFKQSGVFIKNGVCGVETNFDDNDNDNERPHNICFWNDYLQNIDGIENDPYVCWKCINKLFNKKLPPGREKGMSIGKFEEYIKSSYDFINVKYFWKYFSVTIDQKRVKEYDKIVLWRSDDVERIQFEWPMFGTSKEGKKGEDDDWWNVDVLAKNSFNLIRKKKNTKY